MNFKVKELFKLILILFWDCIKKYLKTNEDQDKNFYLNMNVDEAFQ